ncbi:MAG: AEC family transporter, partial [Ruminococcus sp.]
MFAVLSLIVIPVMTLGIGVLLPQSDMVTLTLVFGMAMPSGAMCAILAEQFDKDMLLASEGVAITTFFSLISLPVWAIVLSSIFL